MLQAMSDAPPAETCDCPRDHYRSADGRCVNPSLRSESASLAGYSECGCCVADCPDVHAETGDGLRPVPGSLVVAAEYVDTLDPRSSSGSCESRSNWAS